MPSELPTTHIVFGLESRRGWFTYFFVLVKVETHRKSWGDE